MESPPGAAGEQVDSASDFHRAFGRDRQPARVARRTGARSGRRTAFRYRTGRPGARQELVRGRFGKVHRTQPEAVGAAATAEQSAGAWWWHPAATGDGRAQRWGGTRSPRWAVHRQGGGDARRGAHLGQTGGSTTGYAWPATPARVIDSARGD